MRLPVGFLVRAGGRGRDSALDGREHRVEQRGIRIVRIGHVHVARSVRVERGEQVHLGAIGLARRPFAQDALLAAVEGDHEIEGAEPVGLELARAVRGRVVAPGLEGGDRARVGALADVPVAGGRRGHRDRVVVAVRGDELAEHGLRHRRPADVAGADEADTEERRLVEWAIEAHAPIVPPRPLLHSDLRLFVVLDRGRARGADGGARAPTMERSGKQEVPVNPDPRTRRRAETAARPARATGGRRLGRARRIRRGSAGATGTGPRPRRTRGRPSSSAVACGSPTRRSSRPSTRRAASWRGPVAESPPPIPGAPIMVTLPGSVVVASDAMLALPSRSSTGWRRSSARSGRRSAPSSEPEWMPLGGRPCIEQLQLGAAPGRRGGGRRRRSSRTPVRRAVEDYGMAEARARTRAADCSAAGLAALGGPAIWLLALSLLGCGAVPRSAARHSGRASGGSRAPTRSESSADACSTTSAP